MHLAIPTELFNFNYKVKINSVSSFLPAGFTKYWILIIYKLTFNEQTLFFILFCKSRQKEFIYRLYEFFNAWCKCTMHEIQYHKKGTFVVSHIIIERVDMLDIANSAS